MHDEDLVSDGAGPMAIVICKSSREVQRVASYCRKLLNSSINKAMTVVEAFGAREITKACVSSIQSQYKLWQGLICSISESPA